MPLYDYKCPKCNIEVEVFVNNRDEKVKCEKCGYPMTREFPSNFAVSVFPDGGICLENVSKNGKTFHSKQDMIKYANKNNLELGALL